MSNAIAIVQPTAWPVCGVCGREFVIRYVQLFDLRPGAGKSISDRLRMEWTWMRDCKHRSRKVPDRVVKAPRKRPAPPPVVKYSAHDREMAAVRCSMLADHWARACSGPYSYDFQPTPGSLRLSTEAYARAAHVKGWAFAISETWAEAEALVRSGWSHQP